MDRLIAMGGGGYEPLWNGLDSKGWIGMVSTAWSMADGVLTANPSDATAAITTALYSGDFDFRAELRVLEETGAVPGCGICLVKNSDENEVWGYIEGRLVWMHRDGTKEEPALHVLPGDIDPPLDMRAWNRLEIRARGETWEAWFNGKKRGEVARSNLPRGLSLGLSVQQAKAQWRAVEWLERPR
jgi:hypothetical protein